MMINRVTYLVPIIIGHVHRICPLEHTTIIDQNVDVVDHFQRPVYHFFRILPDCKVARDDVGLTTNFYNGISRIGIIDVSLGEYNSSTSLSECEGNGSTDP